MSFKKKVFIHVLIIVFAALKTLELELHKD